MLDYNGSCRFFVIANAIASGYLVLSLPFSIVCIVRPHLVGPRLFLIIVDTVSLDYYDHIIIPMPSLLFFI
jgi:hypothetical protein